MTDKLWIDGGYARSSVTKKWHAILKLGDEMVLSEESFDTKEEAAEHLAQALRHLQDALGEAKGLEPPHGPQTPLRKEGEV